MNRKLRLLILKALAQCAGVPMPEESLMNAVTLMARPERVTRADVTLALEDVETAGYAQGLSDDLCGVSWTLTEKGRHKAAGL